VNLDTLWDMVDDKDALVNTNSEKGQYTAHMIISGQITPIVVRTSPDTSNYVRNDVK
jgi:hypothetical protein